MSPRNWTERGSGLAFLLIVDLIAIFDAFSLGYLCRFEWGLFLPPLSYPASTVEYAKAWVMGIYVAVVLFHAYGLYDRARVRSPAECLLPLARAGVIAVLFILALSYFYRGFSFSRMAALYSCGFALLLVGGFRLAWEGYRRSLLVRAEAATPVLLVGCRAVPRFLARRMSEQPELGMRLVAVADDVADESPEFSALPRGTLEEVPQLVARSGAQEVLIGHPALGHERLLRLIETCEQLELRVRIVPATYDLLIDLRDVEEIGGIPLVTVNERRRRPVGRLVKRLLDLSLGFTTLVLTLPVLALAAIAVRLDSRGPILFRQRRVGRDGREFDMFKLRTMVCDAEERLKELIDLDELTEPVFKLRNDPRVTRIGRFLRRFSIDELPQLLNVLRGEMSLVGPRPEEKMVVARYDTWERRRLKLKPGITGLQQLHSRGSTSLRERVRWDIIYLRNESLILDLWILLRTVGAVLGGRGAR